jgi:hypothetical protein
MMDLEDAFKDWKGLPKNTEREAAIARVAVALTVVLARRLVGFAARAATGTASAARITRIECDCD